MVGAPATGAPAAGRAREGAGRRPMVAALSLTCGLSGATLYIAQPVVGAIGAGFGVGPGPAGAVPAAAFAGYGLGLVLLVPLADLVEWRRLVVGAAAAAALA
ncbi:MAG: MFS transporter, partial [Acidimicrobiales bacterium]